MAETKIEWADFTWNPWIGCTKVSPACDHCYAEAMMDTRYGRARWGAGEDRVRTSEANRKMPFKWNREAKADGVRRTVFCLSLGDIWDNEIDPLWRYRTLETMHATTNLIYLLLSKRIGNAVKMTDPLAGHMMLPPNAALGATMVNQDEWDRDGPKLHDAARALDPLFTFASVEPMLGPITVKGDCPDWVICGGESGRDARDMPTAWAAHLRDGTWAHGKAFFMKQMTGRAPIPAPLMVRQFPVAMI